MTGATVISHDNEEPAAAMDHGGLKFVLTTTRLNSGKDNRYDLLPANGVRVNAR